MTLDEAKNYADQLTMLCAKYNDAHRSGQLNEKRFYSDKFEHIAGLIKNAGFKLRRRYVYNSRYINHPITVKLISLTYAGIRTKAISKMYLSNPAIINN